MVFQVKGEKAEDILGKARTGEEHAVVAMGHNKEPGAVLERTIAEVLVEHGLD